MFKFISIPLDEPLKNNNLESTSLNDISNQLIKKLNESIGNTNDVISLNDNLVDEFKKINKEMRQKKFDFLKYYDYQIKIINKRSSQKKDDYKLIDEKKYDKLFKFFNYDLSNNKNLFSNQIKLSEELNLFINKIFLFGVKYYNCYEKLNKLKRQIEEQIKIENEQDIKANINLVKKFENYSLFYSFYKASYKIKEIYHKHKSKFKTSNFDKENKQYFEVNFQKLEFFYNNIIPCDDITMQPNITIINEVQDILDNPDIGINEIKKFLQLQTMNSQIKLIKLSIINNLLLYLNNEENIIFLLNLICKKMRNTNIQLNLFDNMFGADYFNMEKLKYQFHLLLHILSYKNINNQNKYSIITQISLTESLMWKIKGRSFPVLNEIMKVFEDIKNINNEQNLFIFENNNIYNINYYNKRKLIEIKFEVFKILVSQIIDKIKEILIFKKENKNKLSIERDPSNISNDDFKNICIIIFSYFTDIKQESLLYYEIILFFYKIFINSDMMINFILEKYPKVISKIINIALNINELNIKNKNENYINNREQNNRLIMIKLLC